MDKLVNYPNIMWNIGNLPSTDKKLSPIIKFCGLKFFLNFSQFKESSKVKLQLILECQDVPETLSNLELAIKVCIISTGGNRYMKKTEKCTLKHNTWCIWTDFLSTYLDNCGSKEQITFVITMTPGGTLHEILNFQESAEEDEHASPCAVSLIEGIGRLFNCEEHSDFTLKCGIRSFAVHKAVLAARSDFFAGMFRSEMKETNEGNGKIENIEPDIFELVLRYLYTGEVPRLSMDSLRKIYAAADTLLVESLRVKCHSLLIESFTNEDSEEETQENDQSGIDEKPETVKEELLYKEERQMLKNLFNSREWRLLSEKFPHRSQEMCKSFFQEL